jgi:hypothetical protein
VCGISVAAGWQRVLVGSDHTHHQALGTGGNIVLGRMRTATAVAVAAVGGIVAGIVVVLGVPVDESGTPGLDQGSVRITAAADGIENREF